MILVHINTIPFYISIHFSFADVTTGYKHFFSCVNCYGLGIAGVDELKNVSQGLNVSMTY